MYSFLHKYGLSAAIGFAALISIIGVIVLNSSSITYVEARETASKSIEINKITDADAKDEKIRENSQALHKESKINGIGFLVGSGNLLIILAGLAALVFPVYQLKDQPKMLIKYGGVLLGGIALFLLAYSLSSNTVENVKDTFSVTEAKLSGALIGIIFIGVIGAVLALIGSEIKGFIKEQN